MPLLMCPNCQTEMKEINRQGVLVDICTQCQGVWLDRGELNKLLEINNQDLAETRASYQPQQQPSRSQQHYHDPRQHHRKKSKLESLFEIFD